MISGRTVTKNPPTKQFMETVAKAGKKPPTGEIVTIEPISWEQILKGAGETEYIEGTLPEGQIIRRYLDNLNPSL